MERLFRDMNHHAAPGIHIVVPGQKIPFTAPAVIVQVVFAFEKGKLFLNTSKGLPVDFNVKGWQVDAIVACGSYYSQVPEHLLSKSKIGIEIFC